VLQALGQLKWLFQLNTRPLHFDVCDVQSFLFRNLSLLLEMRQHLLSLFIQIFQGQQNHLQVE
jgi:hypothetical protein